MTLDMLAEWSGWIQGGLGAVVLAVLAWVGGVSSTRRKLSGDQTAVREDESKQGQMSRLERTIDELQAEIKLEHKERLAAERVATSAVADLRIAYKIIDLQDARLKRAGVSESERADLRTAFGDLRDLPKP